MKDSEVADLLQTVSRLGLTVVRAPAEPVVLRAPTFDDFIPKMLDAESRAQRDSYGACWRFLRQAWGPRPLDEPTPTEVLQLMNRYKAGAVVRSNWRGGSAAARNFLHGVRRLYRLAEMDGLIASASNPAGKVPMPRKLESTRHALTPGQVSELGRVAAETGNDGELDALIVRLHVETACRRQAALRLRVDDLSVDDCTVLLHHKGGVDTWHPITPLLMVRLLEHVDRRGVGASGHQVLRTRGGKPITDRRYDNLHGRFHRHLAWAEAKGVTVHWLRHTTLTFVERTCGEAVARRYAAHRDPGTTATPIYTKASLVECAEALVAVTGQPHPLARGVAGISVVKRDEVEAGSWSGKHNSGAV
ncbi:tyrosine-type recombinase/integrase [Nocardia carnea]|uniref:Tyrosine-type recombinase/integrase n=1 Tax=Nocardia carnea TaxID=37328 RepID=A0ABW7TNT9_9NOCA|nr:site-specific integrase [Nocardia carnea]